MITQFENTVEEREELANDFQYQCSYSKELALKTAYLVIEAENNLADYSY